MSKFKKMLSLVVAMVMVLATTLTAFAAPNTESPYTSKIKVTGLSSREESYGAGRVEDFTTGN